MKIKIDEQAINKIVAENIASYLPGISLLTGATSNEEHWAYLKAFKRTKGSIAMVTNDPKTNAIQLEM